MYHFRFSRVKGLLNAKKRFVSTEGKYDTKK